jgi:hypothetical protein
VIKCKYLEYSVSKDDGKDRIDQSKVRKVSGEQIKSFIKMTELIATFASKQNGIINERMVSNPIERKEL